MEKEVTSCHAWIYVPIKPEGNAEIVLKFLYCLHILEYESSTSLYFSDLAKLVTISPEQGFMQLEVSTEMLFTHFSFCAEQRGSLNIIMFESLKLEGRHLHCDKIASMYFLVVQLKRGSSFWHFLTF